MVRRVVRTNSMGGVDTPVYLASGPLPTVAPLNTQSKQLSLLTFRYAGNEVVMVGLSPGPHDVGFVVTFPSLKGYLDNSGRMVLATVL